MQYYGNQDGQRGKGDTLHARDHGPKDRHNPMGIDDYGNDARKMKRKACDHHTPAVIDVESRILRTACGGSSDNSTYQSSLEHGINPLSMYTRCLLLPTSSSPHGLLRNPSCRPFVPNPSVVYHTYQTANLRAKNQNPITSLSWTPGGRRLITGNADGEFCLWDGNSFQFELIMSAHNTAFRAQTWASSGNYLITTSNRGNLKYWTTSIAPVVSFDAHDQTSINAVSFAPSDNKFVTCGDDRAVNIFDFETQKLERNLAGHGWDVKTCQWHPGASVVASGGKDNLVKLWDPRSGSNLATLYGHKNTVTKVAWSPNGNWLLTASRDQMIKLYDIREMKELCSLKGHYKEVTSLAWHPQFETVFASGGMDGTLLYWNVGPKGSEEPAARVPFAHDMAIWDMEWHPSGHCIATGSNDRTTKVWCRPRPGDPMYTEWFNDVPGEPDLTDFDENEILFDEIELGAHVGIVIGKKGATIISMQRVTGTKMHVDQQRKVLEIEGTAAQLDHVKKRIGKMLERVEAQVQNQAMGITHTPSTQQTYFGANRGTSNFARVQGAMPPGLDTRVGGFEAMVEKTF
ncbi:hypothetical protein TrCOL_g6311 [Triparma columacea]|uniref:K Homology domain-containing protein n=1 Tax=Triparma columacea TaxID=722753 RepID=A0A9W7LB02_9STRA|nr:hypothetical protein TrCOL_g6311 [Triparma columacea]